jgi:hypothetical protein
MASSILKNAPPPPPPPPTVELTLSLHEAATMLAVLAKIGGMYASPRGYTQNVLKALQTALTKGCNGWPENADGNSAGEGRINFEFGDNVYIDRFVKELRL